MCIRDRDKNKLDEIALQFTAAEAKNKITTVYVGVINKTAEIDLVVTEKEVTVLDAKEDKCHYADSKADAIAQAALIDASNMPQITNHHLVQNVVYSQAIAGIDLNELVHACDIKAAAGLSLIHISMYSCSKTFVGVAIGLAIADNRLRLTDRLSIFFPESLPDTV